MTTPRNRRPALDLIEEAVHLLRSAPGRAFAWYYVGTIPFVLSVLYFWTDMSWSPDARRDCAVSAGVVALLFGWMKFCQSMFADALRKQVSLDRDRALSLGQMVRIFVQQTIIQPSKLFILPLAFVITLPFGWACAFYENVTLFGGESSVRELAGKAWRQAKLWPQENHLGLLMFFLFRIVTAVNVLVVLIITPNLLKMLSGFENMFTRTPVSMLNSTALAVICAGTYLCCDPFLKAFFALRCFYGEALGSGEDLQVELRRLRRIPVVAMIAIAFALPLGSLCAAVEQRPVHQGSVQVQELNRAIDDTLNDPRFRWRMPREEGRAEAVSHASHPAIERWLRSAARTVRGWGRSFSKWLDRISRSRDTPEIKGGATGPAPRTALEVCLIAAIVALLMMLGWKIRQYFASQRAGQVKAPTSATVDLANEEVRAEELPEDDWMAMARELIGRGELNLALRALFFAGMAHLGHRQVIVLARYKSNWDYQMELRRRAPGDSALQNAFAENRLAVERAWYGGHQVDQDIVSRFQVNLARIQDT